MAEKEIPEILANSQYSITKWLDKKLAFLLQMDEYSKNVVFQQVIDDGDICPYGGSIFNICKTAVQVEFTRCVWKSWFSKK